MQEGSVLQLLMGRLSVIRSCSLGLALAVALALIAPSASAVPLPLRAFMDAQQEVPPNGRLAIGAARLIYDPDLATLTINAAVLGIETGDVIGFHIHGPAAPGENADIILNLGILDWNDLDVGPPPGLNGMVFSAQYDVTALSQAAADAIASNQSYLNLHTSAFPNGEIRGQIVVVPEPGTALLMALGLVGLARVGPRRQR